MKVSIYIATRNRVADLRKTLQACLEQDYSDLEILVLDDASTDGTSEAVRREFPSVLLTREDVSIGSIRGRNKLVAMSKGELLLGLDDDSYLVDPQAVGKIVAKMKAEPKVGILALQIIGPEFPETLDSKNHLKGEHFYTAFGGGGVVIRKSAFAAVGDFCGFFFHAHEEPDFALRVWDAGTQVKKWNDIVVYHSYSPRNRNEQRVHHWQARNEILGIWMRYPWHLVLPFVVYTTLSQARFAAKRGWLSREIFVWLDILRLLPLAILNRRSVKAQTIKLYKFLGRQKLNSEAELEKIQHLTWRQLFQKLLRA